MTTLDRRQFLSTLCLGTAAGAVGFSGSATGLQTGTADWPTAGYDVSRRGHNPDGAGPRADVGLDWRGTGSNGSITAAPAVVDGTIYAASESGQLLAFDAGSGESFGNWPVSLDGDSACPPTVVSGTVYVGDEAGVLHAIDAATGQQEWRFGTGGPIEGAPAVVDDVVYAASGDGLVYAIDAATGEQTEWTFDTLDSIEGGPAVDTSGETATVYVGNDSGLVYGIDAETGSLEWEEPFEAPGPVRGTPAIADGTLYVPSLGGVPQNGFVIAIDGTTGREQWRFSADGAVVASPAVGEDQLYVGSRSQQVYAVNRGSGEREWTADTGRQVISAPALVDGTVYAASFSNEVFGFREDGSERFRVETGGSVSASPAVADGRVFVGSEDGSVYALAEGGEFDPVAGGEDTDDEPETTDSPLQDDRPGGITFLAFPAAVVAFVLFLAGSVYAVLRSDWADQFAVDEAPIEELYDDAEEAIPDYSDRQETTVWSAIVGDVISRASEREKTATEDVIVSKYVDETLDAPVTAYEIESLRDDDVLVTITEPFVDDTRREQLADRPLNEGWSLGTEELTFETPVEAGGTVRTMIGRLDCPEDRIEALTDSMSVTIESLGDDGDGSDSTGSQGAES